MLHEENMLNKDIITHTLTSFNLVFIIYALFNCSYS
jgi:hypothetical protein